MINGFPSQREVKAVKGMYPPESRIEVISVDDEYVKIAPGTKGTVKLVDDIGTVHVKLDTGVNIGLVYKEDKYKKVK